MPFELYTKVCIVLTRSGDIFLWCLLAFDWNHQKLHIINYTLTLYNNLNLDNIELFEVNWLVMRIILRLFHIINYTVALYNNMNLDNITLPEVQWLKMRITLRLFHIMNYTVALYSKVNLDNIALFEVHWLMTGITIDFLR